MKIYRGDLHRFEGPQRFHTTLFDIGIHDLGKPETCVELELEVHQQTDDFLLSGMVGANLTLACDRCLGVADISIKGSFRVWLVSAMRPGLNTGEDDVRVFPAPEKEVDLSALIAGTIYVELPSKTLCREDCKGLCPSCGADLNRQPCKCEAEKTDERWTPLLKMKQQLEE